MHDRSSPHAAEPMMYYLLAKEFGIKPSEVAGEEWKRLQELMIISSASAEKQRLAIQAAEQRTRGRK